MRFLVRLIFVACLVWLALSFIRMALDALALSFKRPKPPAPQEPSESSPERLVRDPVCGVFIAEKAAIWWNGQAFCSEECRKKLE
ncbi:MAG TPA: PP0621 family protein [Terriglobia bacterium]|nr:PP0621 family protein [Terriglobia bacterium]